MASTRKSLVLDMGFRMDYFYQGKNLKPEDGIMLGNGSMGALVFGDGHLQISLDLISLWDHRLPKEYREKDFCYASLERCVQENRQEFDRLFDGCYNHPYPTKINAGMVNFALPLSPKSRFNLDYGTGVFSLIEGKEKITGYINANEDVLVLTSKEKLVFSFSTSPYLYAHYKNGGLGYPKPIEEEDADCHYLIQPMTGNKAYSILAYSAPFGDGWINLFSVFKGKEVNKKKQRLISYVAHALERKGKHLEFWNEYYAQSSLCTGDERIDSLYQKSLYFFGCNSRKKFPMTLQGVWTRNDGRLPPWKSDLHHDINVQMTYDAYRVTGHKKEGEVLVSYYRRLKKQFEKFASSFMGSGGLLIPGVMSQKGEALGGWGQYAFSPAVSIWALCPIADYYFFYRDQEFLKNVAFPFFQETEKCIRACLGKDSRGVYAFSWHSSPEYCENGDGSFFGDQTNFELTMLRYLYSTLVRLSRDLGQDETPYLEALQSLPEDYRDERGLLMISETHKFDMSHRHFSHMLMYKNLDMVDCFAERAVIQKDVKNLLDFGTEAWVGFSFTEASGLCSYARDGENALRYLEIFADAFTKENGFHMNEDYKHLGYSSVECYVMTLEANQGFVRSCADMMLQSYQGVVAVFPAIPLLWHKRGVSFSNLRVPGDHRVSASLKDDQIHLSIRLVHPDLLKIENRFGDQPVLKLDGKEMRMEARQGDIMMVEAKEEITYEGLFA